MEGELIDAGLNLWREIELFLRSMTSPWRLSQIGIILALLAVAPALRNAATIATAWMAVGFGAQRIRNRLCAGS